MAWIRYLSHPEVVIDPSVPVPEWSLRGEAVARIERLVSNPPTWFDEVRVVITSAETKAREAADPIGRALGLEPLVITETGEIDRSATGFVPHERHEELTDRLFAEPERSAEGWEPAFDAQRRMLDAVRPWWPPTAVDEPGGVLMIGHGGVGTLLWCALTGTDIARRHDQPGQGHVWCVDTADPKRNHPWRRF